MLLQWHVTERCNLRCSHCYQEGCAAPEPSWDEVLATLERLEDFLATCRRRRGGRPFRAHITVSGGEPFVRADFPQLLERLASRRSRYSFAVLTNGTLIDAPLARRLAELGPGFVQVSLDGGPATHDRIRGRGAHARAVAGIGALVGAGVPTFISFTALRSNFREFPAVAKLGLRLGVQRVWADRMVPWGQSRDAGGEVLTPEETREWVGLMRAEGGRRGLRRSPVALHRALQFTATAGCPYRCAAGETLLTVLPAGEVLPCRRMPVEVGNLHATPLAELYDSSPTLRTLRDRQRVSIGCERCFYAETCGGGLRCLSFAVHGDAFRADPGCWLAARTAAPRPSPGSTPGAGPLIPLEALTRRIHVGDRSPAC